MNLSTQIMFAKSKAAQFMPLILGVILGLLSVAKYPPFPPNFVHSGIMVIGGAIGYLLAALFVAYINAKSWKQSFFTASLTIIIATAVYYFHLVVARMNGNNLVEHYSAMAIDAGKWVVIGTIVGDLSAAVARFAIYSKRRLLRLSALIVPYIFFLVVVGSNILRMINWYNKAGYLTDTWVGYNFCSDLYETGWVFVLSTVLFVIGTIRAKKSLN